MEALGLNITDWVILVVLVASGLMSFINIGMATLSVIGLGLIPSSSLVAFTIIITLFFIGLTIPTLFYMKNFMTNS